MNATRRRLSLLALFILIPASWLPARGGGQAQEAEQPVSVFLVVGAGQAENDLYVSRFLLPGSLSLFAWSDFRIQDGEVSVEGEGVYRIRADRLELVESVGENAVLRYDFLPSESQKEALPLGRRPGDETIEVSFNVWDLVGGNGEPLYQPARWAVVSAIGESGGQSGSVRLLDVEYLGEGAFRAEVAVR